MRHAWRWTLRGVAVLALVAGGVLLALHPSANWSVTDTSISPDTATFQCLSPFNRLTSEKQLAVLSPPGALSRVVQGLCANATNGREHAVEALGAGTILLVGLSFVPRRRALATERSPETSPV